MTVCPSSFPDGRKSAVARRWRAARWGVGPAIGLILFTTAVQVGFGPGLLLLSVYGAAGFALGMPVLQFILGRRAWFRGREGASMAFAAGIVVAGLVAAIASGRFFYW